MLHASAQVGAAVAARLRENGDWQYTTAVALRAYADAYARHLGFHLRAERIDDFAWRLTRHAAMCTRELAPIAPLWERAGVLAWQLRSTTRPHAPVKERMSRVLRRAHARPSVSLSSQSLLRALFAS
ncbi:MAG TPA: hypothetical protein VEU74_09815 [Gemmatimonadales bacterium]|nr:hypothetical protein [Gemmatimonadales bacterium]